MIICQHSRYTNPRHYLIYQSPIWRSVPEAMLELIHRVYLYSKRSGKYRLLLGSNMSTTLNNPSCQHMYTSHKVYSLSHVTHSQTILQLRPSAVTPSPTTPQPMWIFVNLANLVKHLTLVNLSPKTKAPAHRKKINVPAYPPTHPGPAKMLEPQPTHRYEILKACIRNPN